MCFQRRATLLYAADTSLSDVGLLCLFKASFHGHDFVSVPYENDVLSYLEATVEMIHPGNTQRISLSDGVDGVRRQLAGDWQFHVRDPDGSNASTLLLSAAKAGQDPIEIARDICQQHSLSEGDHLKLLQAIRARVEAAEGLTRITVRRWLMAAILYWQGSRKSSFSEKFALVMKEIVQLGILEAQASDSSIPPGQPVPEEAPNAPFAPCPGFWWQQGFSSDVSPQQLLVARGASLAHRNAEYTDSMGARWRSVRGLTFLAMSLAAGGSSSGEKLNATIADVSWYTHPLCVLSVANSSALPGPWSYLGAAIRTTDSRWWALCDGRFTSTGRRTSSSYPVPQLSTAYSQLC